MALLSALSNSGKFYLAAVIAQRHAVLRCTLHKDVCNFGADIQVQRISGCGTSQSYVQDYGR
eukprot:19332-Heterococcus_DN1.PRE.2